MESDTPDLRHDMDPRIVDYAVEQIRAGADKATVIEHQAKFGTDEGNHNKCITG